MTQTDPDELPARATVPTITEAADLLALLREAPRRRAVAYQHFFDHQSKPAVCEYEDERIEGKGRILAVIEAGSADDLLHTAIDVDVRQDCEGWIACPIRHRSTGSKTTWVSPDHPAAPSKREFLLALLRTVDRRRQSASETESDRGPQVPPNEVPAIQRLAEMTGLPTEKIASKVFASQLSLAQFQIAKSLIVDEWQWRNWFWQWRSNPVRQQAELQLYADSLKLDNRRGSVWPHKGFVFVPRGGGRIRERP